MKSPFRLLAVSAGLFFAVASFAQTAAPAAAVAPAVAAVKAAPAAAAAAVVPAAAPVAAAAAKPAAKAAPAAAPAAGGGAGKVWVNTKSKTYHCEGTKFYGKTKVGEYMAEADAKAAGNHGVGGKGCAAK